MAEHEFFVGQRVKKVTGDYQITGEIRAIFTMANGTLRFVVEHKAEGGGSFLHIYAYRNLEPLPVHIEQPSVVQQSLNRIEAENKGESALDRDWHYDSQGYCDNPGRGY